MEGTGTVWGKKKSAEYSQGLKCVMRNRYLWKTVKEEEACMKGMVVPTALTGAENWNTRGRRKEIECAVDEVFEEHAGDNYDG